MTFSVSNPCNEVYVNMGLAGGINYQLNHYTWRRPAHVFGIVHDVLRQAWARRPILSSTIFDMEAIEINATAVHRLALAAYKLTKIDLRQPDDIHAWMRHRGLVGIADYMVQPSGALSPQGSNERRRFALWEDQPAHRTYSDIRACKRALCVTPNAMPTTLGPLFTVSRDDILHLEMRWRVKDAVPAGKHPLKGRRRAAFEAIWIAGEYARAYEYAGVPSSDWPKFWGER